MGGLILDGILVAVCGVLCVPSLLAKNEQMKDALKVIGQFQGWLGIVCFGWGIWGIIRFVMWLSYIGVRPIGMITFLALSVAMAGVGFLLGFGLIQQYALAKAPDDAKAKAEELHGKLMGLQVPLGFLCIGIGIWTIIYDIVLSGMLNL
jgi:hypothetical protein